MVWKRELRFPSMVLCSSRDSANQRQVTPRYLHSWRLEKPGLPAVLKEVLFYSRSRYRWKTRGTTSLLLCPSRTSRSFWDWLKVEASRRDHQTVLQEESCLGCMHRLVEWTVFWLLQTESRSARKCDGLAWEAERRWLMNVTGEGGLSRRLKRQALQSQVSTV
jgi:hypothetical protein